MGKAVAAAYDDKCGCRFAYCESQLLDTAQCCEYYRENSECDGASKGNECEATCVGQTFKGGMRKGQDVCSTTICEDPLNWVNLETNGCTREPSKKDACCDQKTCAFAEEETGTPYPVEEAVAAAYDDKCGC